MTERELLGLAGLLGGLLGAAVAAVLSTLKEWWFLRQRNRKDAEFLCVRISSLLDRFVWQCVDVIYDDGTDHGRLSYEDYGSPQVKTPIFQPELLQLEWQSIPTYVMADVLNFPNVISKANRRIFDFFENCPTPDKAEGFEQRQYDYALLGLEAMRIAQKLRDMAGLSIKVEDQEDSQQRFRKVADDYQVRRAERERAHRETWPGLPVA